MIPYILTAVGGYLIGSSFRTKFANGGDIEEYKKWESRYDMLGELYEDASAEERKNIQKEMDELESKMHKSERNYANGGILNPTKKEINDNIKKLMDVVAEKKDYQTQLVSDEISDFEREIIEYTHLPKVMQDEDYLNNMLQNQLRRYYLSNGKPFELSEKKYNFIQEQGLFANGGNVEMDEFEFERKETEKEFANGGEIANTILSQLGGARRLNIMTGAYNFVDLGQGVAFKLKNPRANYVKIQLNSMDLYDIEVGRIRGTDYKVVNSANNLYFDQLKPFIEKATGLYLSL